jgi:hypothetical protein
MKHTIRIIAILIVIATVGCYAKKPVQTDASLRLTREEVLRAKDGTRIIVYLPHGVERPVVFKSIETNTWVISAKVIDD